MSARRGCAATARHGRQRLATARHRRPCAIAVARRRGPLTFAAAASWRGLATVAAAALLLAVVAFPAVADDGDKAFPVFGDELDQFGTDEPVGDPFGFGVWLESFTHTSDINGGTYVSVSAAVFLGRRVLADLRYMTDLVPATFDDHLLELSAQINVGDVSRAAPAMTFGPAYLTDVSSFWTNHYLGIAWSVFNSWRSGLMSDEFGFYINALSFRLMWDLTDGERLFSFTVLEPKFF